MTWMRRFLVLGATLLPAPALAHGFGRLYNLPVPFWLYAWGAAAALLVSFLVVGYFVTVRRAAAPAAGGELTGAPWVERLRRWRILPALQLIGVALLVLCIVTGLFGSRDPYRNFSMTFFWIVFLLAFAYLTALVGNLYAAISPWRVIVAALGRRWRSFARGRVPYPAWLGDWPALGFYMALIAYELFGRSTPFSLGSALLGYTVLNLAGAWLVGAAAWFEHCEFFGLFLRLLAKMAPLDYRPAAAPGGRGSLRWRLPFAGLLEDRPESLSRVAFLLFMLSSTAFDGLRATQSWVFLFWKSALLEDWLGRPPFMAYNLLRPWYAGFEVAGLIASPFVYLGIYLSFVGLARAVARSARPLRELALDFAYTLLPIALVYNVTHYFTLLLGQGLKIFSLASDPFGWGWNLFGTATSFRATILPEMGAVWHTQVGLILLGHIVSVVLAHVVALRVFPTQRQAVLSQVPMLGLMVVFTVAGLWILAQPLTAVRSM
jgi:hypothetical protein